MCCPQSARSPAVHLRLSLPIYQNRFAFRLINFHVYIAILYTGCPIITETPSFSICSQISILDHIFPHSDGFKIEVYIIIYRLTYIEMYLSCLYDTRKICNMTIRSKREVLRHARFSEILKKSKVPTNHSNRQFSNRGTKLDKFEGYLLCIFFNIAIFRKYVNLLHF